jgi:hypothetical protein
VFAGIKGLIASGPGTKKTIDAAKLRPEGKTARIDPGNVKAASGKGAMTQKSAGVVKPHGAVSVKSNIRSEPAVKRDSASVAKPF